MSAAEIKALAQEIILIRRQRLGKGPYTYIFSIQSFKESAMFVTQAVVDLTKWDCNGVENPQIVRVAKSKQGWKEALETLRGLVSTAETEDGISGGFAEVIRDLNLSNGKQPSKEG